MTLPEKLASGAAASAKRSVCSGTRTSCRLEPHSTAVRSSNVLGALTTSFV